VEAGRARRYHLLMEIKVVLGPEYDQRLHDTLTQVLREMGAVIEPATWGVGGSQELSTWEAAVRGQRLRMESETYFGLSVSGDQSTVKFVATEVRSRIRS
jgi:hypothetical protein